MTHKGSLLLNGLTKADSLTIQRLCCSTTEKFSFRFSLMKSSTKLSQSTYALLFRDFRQRFLMLLQCRCLHLWRVNHTTVVNFLILKGTVDPKIKTFKSSPVVLFIHLDCFGEFWRYRLQKHLWCNWMAQKIKTQWWGNPQTLLWAVWCRNYYLSTPGNLITAQTEAYICLVTFASMWRLVYS